MSKEKVYQVTVTMEVYGHSSKRAAADFLNEALHVDGLSLPRYIAPSEMQEVPEALVSLTSGEKKQFAVWKGKLDAIAAEEGFTPKDSPAPGELNDWVKHFRAGKTPAQAWAVEPYKKRR